MNFPLSPCISDFLATVKCLDFLVNTSYRKRSNK